MVKMVSLKKSSADRAADKEAMGSPGLAMDSPDSEGISVNLEHHHLMKMGVGGGLKSGHKVKLEGEGTVEHSETRSGPEGERHSARLRLTRGGVEHEGGAEEKEAERGEIKTEISKAHDKAEQFRVDREAKRKDGASGKKVAEGA